MIDRETIPVITIDGPSGTGKGTLCHKVAGKLGWHFLDSGAIYRVLAFAAEKQGISSDLIEELSNLALDLKLQFETCQNSNVIALLDGEDVSSQIRSESIGKAASVIAALPEVREALLARQRAFAKSPGLVTDGRDMGTIVFPKANLKIYLYATSAERAMRRYLQLQDRGISASLGQVMSELELRDKRDMARPHAPLIPADDAVLIDTTGLTIAQVLGNILQLVRERL
jgi:CMP/dCMP kinase